MKPKTVILMAVAIVCGLAASYMTSRVIAERDTQTEVEKVTVLVARKNLAMGQLIKEPEKLFEEKQFTKGEEPKKAIRNYEDLKDRRMNKPLTAEQFVTADDLNDKDKEGLPAVIQKGMRAIGLTVNAERMVGGFVLPHSHVDIVCAMTGGNNGESNAKTILQNVLVLAVDQTSQRPEDKAAVVASVVTVQVTPEQAERLVLAQRMGTISLILRSFGDDEKVATTGVTNQQILKNGDSRSSEDLAMDDDTGRRPHTPPWGSKVPDVPAAPVTNPPAEAKAPEPPPPAPKVRTMTIYNGTNVTKAVFTFGETEDDIRTQIEKSPLESEPSAKPAARPESTQKP